MRNARSLALQFFVVFLASVSASESSPPGKELPKAANADAYAPTDWPCYLGLNGNCTSTETGLLHKWPANGPKEMWRAPIGMGWSCPAVAGDDVVLIMANFVEATGADLQKAEERIVCLSAKSGEKRWEYSYKPNPFWCGWWQGGPRGTPTITSKYVYTVGMMGHLTCLNRATGALVWQVELGKETIPLMKQGDVKGFAESPVVVDGRVIFNIWCPDTRDTSYTRVLNAKGEKEKIRIYGFDAETGKLAWTYDEEPVVKSTGNQTPTVSVVTINNEKCILTCLNRHLVALRASDGKKIWSYEHTHGDFAEGTSTAPLITSGNNLLYTPTSAFGRLQLLTGDLASADPKIRSVWEKTDLNLHMTSLPMTIYRGSVYGFNIVAMDPNEWKFKFNLMCMDEQSGKTQWTGEEWTAPGSMIAADGLLFVRNFKTLRLLEANPKQYVELGKIENMHNAVSKAFSGPALIDYVMPVLSNGRLFVRLPGELLCLDVKHEK
jgi:outer membrane protein assembly factor BamB